MERLTARKSGYLERFVEQALVVELKNGEVYGGRLDEYEGGERVIHLYSCRLLDKKHHKWVDLDIMVKSGEGPMADPSDRDFQLSEIRDIFVLPEEQRDKLELEDALQIYIDPHYRPLTGIACHWHAGDNWENKEHCAECDARLHEALAVLKIGTYDSSKEVRRRVGASFAYIRRWLLMSGARIP